MAKATKRIYVTQYLENQNPFGVYLSFLDLMNSYIGVSTDFIDMLTVWEVTHYADGTQEVIGVTEVARERLYLAREVRASAMKPVEEEEEIPF